MAKKRLLIANFQRKYPSFAFDIDTSNAFPEENSNALATKSKIKILIIVPTATKVIIIKKPMVLWEVKNLFASEFVIKAPREREMALRPIGWT